MIGNPTYRDVYAALIKKSRAPERQQPNILLTVSARFATDILSIHGYLHYRRDNLPIWKIYFQLIFIISISLTHNIFQNIKAHGCYRSDNTRIRLRLSVNYVLRIVNKRIIQIILYHYRCWVSITSSSVIDVEEWMIVSKNLILSR